MSRRTTGWEKSKVPCRGCVVSGFIAFGCCGVVGFVNYRAQAKADTALTAADRLPNSGNQADAAAKYQEAFTAPNGSSRQPEILKRLVEQAIKRGETEAASKWVEKGIKGCVDVVYDSRAATELLEIAKAKVEVEELQTAAQRMAEKFVKRNVKFPEEAEVTTLRYRVPQRPDGRWRFFGTVAAKNAFGVKTKYDWSVLLEKQKDGRWHEIETELTASQ